jgi:hypothetical protein
MSKKITAAHRELVEALRKHAKVVDDRPVSLKKAQRAVVTLQAAVAAYASAVQAKTGMDNPFVEVPPLGLADDTIISLEAERDALASQVTGPIEQASA